MGSLRKADNGLQRHDLIFVAWRLTAPWRSVYIRYSINDTDDRIVVIQEGGTVYII